MSDRKQQRQLLGYLLGALDDPERERVEHRRVRDPGLAIELARGDESLEPLRRVQRVYRPPEGLAARTCRMVFAYSEALTARMADAGAVRRQPRPRARAMSPAAVPPVSTVAWGWSDLVVAVVVFLAVASMIFPAIQRSRMNMRLASCQNTLGQIGIAHAQIEQAWPEPVAGVTPGIRVAAQGLPAATLFRDGSLADAAMGAENRPSPTSLVRLGRGRSSLHQGLDQQVQGRNLLFLDGHVTFLAMGPVTGPGTGEFAPGDDPAPASWPPESEGQPAIARGLSPLVLVSCPLP